MDREGAPCLVCRLAPFHSFFFSRRSFLALSRWCSGLPSVSLRPSHPPPPPPAPRMSSYPNRLLGCPGYQAGTRDSHMILAFMPGTDHSAVATLGPRTDESTGDQSLSLSLSLSCCRVSVRVCVCVCAARHILSPSAPLLLPPSSQLSQLPQLLPPCCCPPTFF